MDERHLIVIGELAVPIRVEDPADAAHAERMQLRGPQRPHAGCAEHGDPVCKRP